MYVASVKFKSSSVLFTCIHFPCYPTTYFFLHKTIPSPLNHTLLPKKKKKTYQQTCVLQIPSLVPGVKFRVVLIQVPDEELTSDSTAIWAVEMFDLSATPQSQRGSKVMRSTTFSADEKRNSELMSQLLVLAFFLYTKWKKLLANFDKIWILLDITDQKKETFMDQKGSHQGPGLTYNWRRVSLLLWDSLSQINRNYRHFWCFSVIINKAVCINPYNLTEWL